MGREEVVVQIILISDRLARTRSVQMSLAHFVGSAFFALVLIFAATAALYWLTLRYAADIRLPALRRLVAAAQQAEAERERQFVQQNLNSMAMKLGEMQAQLTRMDALGERLSALAGIRPRSSAPAKRRASAARRRRSCRRRTWLSAISARSSLTLARQVESRNDMLGVLEAQLFEQAVKKKMIPTMMPVRGPYNASGFGRRVDPFNGQWAMHDGIDFIAEYGSPIVAAAAGVVVFSGFHPQYGYMVDIDHGNDLVTRYAHCSKLVVREGDLVQRGRKIGEVGSTGRSTGPHLHFEVRFRGAPQNPSSSWCRTPTPPWRGPSKFQLESVVLRSSAFSRAFPFTARSWKLFAISSRPRGGCRPAFSAAATNDS